MDSLVASKERRPFLANGFVAIVARIVDPRALAISVSKFGLPFAW
jgi:hypothetical protein